MNVTITDANLINKLVNSSAPVNLVAADGMLLGTFTRTPEGFRVPPVSEAELAAIRDPSSCKWHPAAEVEAKLRELRCSK